MLSLIRPSLLSVHAVTVVLSLSPEGPDERFTVRSIEAATAYSQTLSQWCFVIIGGTMLVLLQNSFYRPAKPYARWSVLSFAPAWGFLAASIFYGTRAQRVYLAYLLNSATTLPGARDHLNYYMGREIWTMEAGLVCFIPWLVLTLVWWTRDYDR